MTATDCLTTPDAVALLAAIDAGDDTALPPLAEERLRAEGGGAHA